MDCGGDEVDVGLNVSGDGVGVASDMLSSRLVFVDMIFGFEELLSLGDGRVNFDPMTTGVDPNTLSVEPSIN